MTYTGPERRVQPSPGLLRALEVVEALPRRDWDESAADSPEACAARSYNAGLWDARAAISREILAGRPTLDIEETP